MFRDLFDMRKSQLKDQEQIDKNLAKYIDVCPKELFKLILSERELNRRQMDSLDFMHPMLTYEKVLENIKNLDVLYEKMKNFSCK